MNQPCQTNHVLDEEDHKCLAALFSLKKNEQYKLAHLVTKINLTCKLKQWIYSVSLQKLTTR